MSCAVYFNLDGTLVDHDLDYEEIYRQAVAEAGLDDVDDAYQTYTDRFFQYFQNGWTFPRRQAITDIMRDRDIADIGVSDRFAAAWEAAEADAATPKPGIDGLFQGLPGDASLGIATNGTGALQRAKLENAGLVEAVDAVLVSSEIGVTKPNADFFEHAREELDAERYVIVSHDLRRDILPATREDFRTVWISDEAAENPQIGELVDRRVPSLADVGSAVQELCG